MANIVKKSNISEIIIPQKKLDDLHRELTNIREEFADNKYINEAITVLAAGGFRSAIGSYWNAVVDDLRRKIMHRSIDLFNKEISPKKEIKTYEDFQIHLTDYELIEGAYKIGVLNWEAYKILHQARETRNIFYGHPDSSDPTIIKVLNMIADCNRYVLSQDYPLTIIDVNQYILTMDTDSYAKNEIAVEQAFTDLPEIYKKEMTNRLFILYIGENASIGLKSNIEFSYPILWKVISKEIRQQIGKSYDKLIIEGNGDKIEKANNLLTIVKGLRYVSAASRKILFEPAIKDLEDSLDEWEDEEESVTYLQRLGSNIPTELISRFVSALTLTFVGYKGGSYRYNRTDFYSNAAAPKISEMFQEFDNTSTEAFIETIKTNETLQSRIIYTVKLNRLRTLGNILLNKPEIREDTKKFLKILVDEGKTKKFFALINSR